VKQKLGAIAEMNTENSEVEREQKNLLYEEAGGELRRHGGERRDVRMLMSA
jgi:hypothetical protein